MDKIVSENSIEYEIIKLLGHGKGGYSPNKIKGGPSGPPAVPVLTSIWNLVTMINLLVLRLLVNAALRYL